MTRDDWLVGGDRRPVAADRIYAAATNLVVRGGLDAFDIDTLAAKVHCSRATIYRYAGGKAPDAPMPFWSASPHASSTRFGAPRTV